VYAVVASAVAITYVLNQGETPDSIKALAVAFGGYVIALVNAAYRSTG
jgi:fructoselysine-6-P-deglycase FrlB-like protein